MMVWVWTPLGAWETQGIEWLGEQVGYKPAGDLGLPLGVLAWQVTWIVFFFVAQAVLRRRRLKKEAIAGLSSTPNSESKSG
jgi:hypothetical protein